MTTKTTMIRRGSTGVPLGQHHPKARLTDLEVRLIVTLIEDGMPHRAVASLFEVSRGTVHGIASGRCRR